MGACLTIPLGGDEDSIFVDACYELYSEYSNLNASVGYRLSFQYAAWHNTVALPGCSGTLPREGG